MLSVTKPITNTSFCHDFVIKPVYLLSGLQLKFAPHTLEQCSLRLRMGKKPKQVSRQEAKYKSD